MKKNVLSIAVIAVALFAFGANAQNPDKSQRPACLVEGCTQHQHNDYKPHRPSGYNPFEGIELTDAQKTKIAEMRKNNKEALKQKAEAQRKVREENKMKRDSIIRSGKLNQLRQLKEILTPEQYVTYLENKIVNQPSFRKTKGFGKGNPGKPCDFKKADDRCGHKTHKCDKNKDTK